MFSGIFSSSLLKNEQQTCPGFILHPLFPALRLSPSAATFATIPALPPTQSSSPIWWTCTSGASSDILHQKPIYFRLQLLGGLDMGRSQPSCPFPSCTTTSWPIVDNLLLHYATDHHVIEKIMFCETEAIIRELRKEVATKDEIVESLLSDNAELKEKVFNPI